MKSDSRPPTPPPKKLVDVRVPMLRSVKKRLAVAAIEDGVAAGKLALRYIVEGLDGRERASGKGG